MVNQAARDAKRRVRMVEYRTQGYDHPILPAGSGDEVPEVHDPAGAGLKKFSGEADACQSRLFSFSFCRSRA